MHFSYYGSVNIPPYIRKGWLVNATGYFLNTFNTLQVMPFNYYDPINIPPYIRKCWLVDATEHFLQEEWKNRCPLSYSWFLANSSIPPSPIVICMVGECCLLWAYACLQLLLQASKGKLLQCIGCYQCFWIQGAHHNGFDADKKLYKK